MRYYYNYYYFYFSIITPIFSITWSFRNHFNMLLILVPLFRIVLEWRLSFSNQNLSSLTIVVSNALNAPFAARHKTSSSALLVKLNSSTVHKWNNNQEKHTDLALIHNIFSQQPQLKTLKVRSWVFWLSVSCRHMCSRISSYFFNFINLFLDFMRCVYVK